MKTGCGDRDMAKHKIKVGKRIEAAPEKIYSIIADYENGHPNILPKPYFVKMEVEQGGIGEGTVINFQMKLLGRVQRFRAKVTEPEPGRVLVETDLNTGSVTIFTVEKQNDVQEAYVSIVTVADVRDGIMGTIEGWITAQLLRPIYEKELEQLAVLAGAS